MATDYDLILKNIRSKYEENNVKNDSKNNVLEEISGIGRNIQRNLFKGVIGAGEQLIDFGATIAANVGKAFGANTSNIENFIKRDLTSEFENTNTYKIMSTGYLPNLIDLSQGKEMREDIRADKSMQYAPKVKQVLEGTSQSIGNMLPSIAVTGGLGSVGGISSKLAKGIGMAEFGAQAMGGSVQEGLNQGTDLGSATMYGALEGAKEVATELFVDKILPGGDLYNKALGKQKAITKGVGSIRSIIKDYISMGVNEGAEEVVGDLFDPIIEKLTINKKMTSEELGSRYDITNKENWEQWGMDFITGALSGMVMGSAQVASNIANFGVEGYNIQGTINEAHDIVENITEKERRGTLTESEINQFKEQMSSLAEDYAKQMDALKEKYSNDSTNKNAKRLENASQYKDVMDNYSKSSIQDLTAQAQFEEYNSKAKNKLNYVSLDNNAYNEYLKELGANTKSSSDAFTIANGDIVINKDSKAYKDGTLYSLIGHELTHRLEKLEGYNSVFREYIKSLDETTLQEQISSLREENSTLSEFQAKQEIFADYVGKTAINNPQALDKILGNKTSLRNKLFGKRGIIRNTLVDNVSQLVSDYKKTNTNSTDNEIKYSVDVDSLKSNLNNEIEKTWQSLSEDNVYRESLLELAEELENVSNVSEYSKTRKKFNDLKETIEKNSSNNKTEETATTKETQNQKSNDKKALENAYENKEKVNIESMTNDELVKYAIKINNIVANTTAISNEITKLESEMNTDNAKLLSDNIEKMLNNYTEYAKEIMAIRKKYKSMSASEQMRFDKKIEGLSPNYLTSTSFNNIKLTRENLKTRFNEAKKQIGNVAQAQVNKIKNNLIKSLTTAQNIKGRDSLVTNTTIDNLVKEINKEINGLNTENFIDNAQKIDNKIKQLGNEYEALRKETLGVENKKQELRDKFENAKKKLENINFSEVYDKDKSERISESINNLSLSIKKAIDNVDVQSMTVSTSAKNVTSVKDIDLKIQTLMNYYDNYSIDLEKKNAQLEADKQRDIIKEVKNNIKKSEIAVDSMALNNSIKDFASQDIKVINEKLEFFQKQYDSMLNDYEAYENELNKDYNLTAKNTNELAVIKDRISNIKDGIQKIKERQIKIQDRLDKIEAIKSVASNKDLAKRSFTGIENATDNSTKEKHINDLRNNIIKNYDKKYTAYEKSTKQSDIDSLYKEIKNIADYLKSDTMLQNEETQKIINTAMELDPKSKYSTNKIEIEKKQSVEKKKLENVQHIEKKSVEVEKEKAIPTEIVTKVKNVTHVIKDGIKRISTDSQNTVKYWAEAYKDIYYPLESTEGMFESIEYVVDSIKDLDARFIYNNVENDYNSKAMLIDRINKLANEYKKKTSVDYETKVNNITDEICEGLEIKSFDFNSDGSLRGRDVYKSYKELKNYNYVKEIREAIRKTVDYSLSTDGKNTTFADRVSKAIGNANQQISTMQKEITSLKEEAFKYFNELNKANDFISDLKIEKKVDGRTISALQNQVSKLTKGINLENTNVEYYKNLKSQVDSLMKRVKDLGYTDYRKTNKIVRLESNLFGEKEINSNFRKELVENIKKASPSFNGFNLTNDDYYKVADHVIKGEFDAATDIVFNNAIKELSDVEYQDFMDSDLYSDFKQTIKDSIIGLYNTGNPSRLSKLNAKYNKLLESKNAYKEAQNAIKEIKAVKKTSRNSFGIDSKLIEAFDKVVDINNKSLINGEARIKIQEFINDYNKINPDIELDYIDRQTINDYLDNYSNDTTVLSGEIKDTKEIYKILKNYFKRLHEGRKFTLNNKVYSSHEVVTNELAKEKTINKSYSWNKLDAMNSAPSQLFYMIDGGDTTRFTSQIGEQMISNEVNKAKYYMDLDSSFNEFRNKSKENKDFMDKVLKEKVNIDNFEMSKSEALMVYLLSHDEGGYEHMLRGGINLKNKNKTFEISGTHEIDKVDTDGNTMYYKKNVYKDGELIHKKGDAMTTTIYESDELNNFINKLDELFSDDISQEFINSFWDFSDKNSRKLLYDTQIANYGRSSININSKKHYVSLNVSKENRNTEMGSSVRNLDNIENSVTPGYVKERTSTFGSLDIIPIEQYIKKMENSLSTYAAYSNTIMIMNDVYNIRTQGGTNLINSIGERTASKDGYKGNFAKYMNDWLDDLQGIRPSSTQTDNGLKKVIHWLRSKHAVWALGGNLKSIVMQPASIPTAINYIKPKYLLKGIMTWITSKSNNNLPPLPTMAKYRTYTNAIVEAQTAGASIGKLGNFLMKANSATDNMASHIIWYASYHQAMENGLGYTEAENTYNKAMSTQPNNYVSMSNEFQRSDSELLNLMKMYKNQAFQNSKNLYSSIRTIQFNKTHGIKTTKAQMNNFKLNVCGIVISGAIATAISMMFKKLLDKDEETDEVNEWVEAFLNDNIVSMVPVVSNFVSLDFDSKLKFTTDNWEIPVASIITDEIGYVTDVFDSDNWQEKFKDITYGLGEMLGVPVRNLYNYGVSILKKVSNDENIYEFDAKWKGTNLSTKSEINSAIKKGNTTKAKAYYRSYTTNTMALSNQTINEMFRLYKNGYTNSFVKTIPTTITYNGETIKVDSKKFKQTYSKLTEKLDSINSNVTYNNLDDEGKEYVISKLVNNYYQLAKKEQSSEELNKYEILTSVGYDLTTMYSYLYTISNLEVNNNSTKKKEVEKYINKQRLSANEKYLLYLLAGYSVPNNKKQQLKSYLRRLGIKNTQIQDLID